MKNTVLTALIVLATAVTLAVAFAGIVSAEPVNAVSFAQATIRVTL